jgi:hypothetical protein
MNFTNCRQGFCGAHTSGKISNGVGRDAGLSLASVPTAAKHRKPR